MKTYSYPDVEEVVEEKRAYHKQISKMDELAEKIKVFLDLFESKKKDENKLKVAANKINNSYRCIPKKLKGKFNEKYDIPDNFSLILAKAMYPKAAAKAKKK